MRPHRVNHAHRHVPPVESCRTVNGALPLLYAWALPKERVDAINALLAAWADPTPDEGTWAALRRAGITHIYVGARGEEAKRRALLASPRVRAIHREGDAVVFALVF